MVAVIVGLVIVVLILVFALINLIRKQEKAEDILLGYLEYLDKLSRTIEISDKKLKELDQAGAFRNDDETGVIFKSILQIQEILNDFKLQRIKNE